MKFECFIAFKSLKMKETFNLYNNAIKWSFQMNLQLRSLSGGSLLNNGKKPGRKEEGLEWGG